MNEDIEEREERISLIAEGNNCSSEVAEEFYREQQEYLELCRKWGTRIADLKRKQREQKMRAAARKESWKVKAGGG